MTLDTAILLNNIGFLLIPIGVPLLLGIRVGRVFLTVMCSWLVLVIWFFVQAFVLRAAAHRYDRSLEDIFSDGPHVMPALVCGPAWGVAIACIAQLVRYLLARFSPGGFRRFCKPA